jgi:hypothetical protein
VVSLSILVGVLQTFLEPTLIAETALRTSRSVRLVELSFLEVSPSHLPPGVIVRSFLEGPEGPLLAMNPFDHQVHELMASRFGVQRGNAARSRPL